MAIEALLYDESNGVVEFTATADYAGGEVLQLPCGRAARVPTAVSSGKTVVADMRGVWKLPKTASVAMLAGGRAFWDHSADKAHFKVTNDRDFLVGAVAYDAAESDSYVYVYANIEPRYLIDFQKSGFLSVPTGTKAAGAFGYPKPLGGAQVLEVTATNEAQCIDLLSRDGFSPDAKAIVEIETCVDANGSDNTVDISVGVASGTSTTDADAIAESVFFHLDGGSTNINAECDDGTNEVAATDTTADFTAGVAVANRNIWWIDMRDKTNIKFYVEGVRVLSGTTFTIAAAAGPLKALAHLEKSAGAATGRVTLDRLTVRSMQQATIAA